MPLPFSKSNLPTQLFINNDYVDSKSPRKLSVFNPKDGTLVADNVPAAGAEDVDLAVSCAEKAFATWKKTPPADRRDILLRFATLLEENITVLAELTRITFGAPLAAGKGEISMAVEGLRYYAAWIDKFAGESFPQEDGFLKITRNEPLGVTAGIVPWNGPLVTIGLKAAPALATGNCFIFKPSEKTPFAALALGPLIKEAGFPAGVFQILAGDGSTGALIASHMRIRKVSFTGSCATGRKIQELAAKSNLKRVTLELGGKSPAVVFDDCNLANAVSWTANAITANSGQVCFAASRVYVQEGIYDRFIEEFVKAMKEKGTKLGDPEDEDTQLGPLVDETQYKRVSGFIERGQKGQGKMLTGGPRNGDKVSVRPKPRPPIHVVNLHTSNGWTPTIDYHQGFYIEPTVFSDVDPQSEIHNQEIFGPVAVVKRFKTEEEVLTLSNDTEFGLMAGVFTQDINRAMRVAAEFEAGMVGINCVSLMFLTAPFGGMKESGIGRECGISALRAFTEPKTVMVNLTY